MPPANLPAVGVDRLKRAIEGERCRRSLTEFLRAAWPIVEPGTPLLWGWHLEAICAHLQAVTEGRIRRLIINIPPGHCKSLLVSVFWPAWEWIEKPHLRGLYGSHDPRLAMRDAVRTRDLVSSDWYKQAFNPAWKLKKDQNAKGFFENDAHGIRWTFGMGGQVTGWRGHKVVVDDPLDAKNQFNVGVKDACEFVWDNKLSSRVNNPQEAIFVLVMQRLADDDLAGRLLRRTVPLVDADGNPLLDADGRPRVDEKGRPLREPAYQHVCLPTEFDPGRRVTTSIDWTDPRTEEGELLFPAFFNPQVVEQTKAILGPDGWAGQHQQSPIASGGNKFQGSWFTERTWRWEPYQDGAIRLLHEGEPAELVLLATCSIFATADVAAGQKATNDFTVYCVWALAPRGQILLLAQVRGRFTEPESLREAKSIRVAWPGLICFHVESNGVGLPLIQNMREAALPVVEHSMNRDKVSRAARAIVYAEARRFFIPDPEDHPWAVAWLEEVTLFPNGGHDDRVDNLTLAAEQVASGAIPIPGEAVAVPESGRSSLRPTPSGGDDRDRRADAGPGSRYRVGGRR